MRRRRRRRGSDHHEEEQYLAKDDAGAVYNILVEMHAAMQHQSEAGAAGIYAVPWQQGRRAQLWEL
jgi:hypothetical protein